MYNEELETLIDAALADGVLTDKEREVLFKKAQSMGVDLDEFEMVLNARLLKSNQPASQKKDTKFGDIKKCPACGAEVTKLQFKCPKCGHEFSNVSGNGTTADLLKALDDIDVQSSKLGDETLAVARKIQTIQNFPIPNTKEDIIEMLTLCHANATKTADKNIAKAWAAKTTQILSKSEIVLKNDPDAQIIVNKIVQSEKVKSRKKLIFYICIAFAGIIAIGGVVFLISSKHQKNTVNDEQISMWQNKVNEAIQQAEYPDAVDYLDSLNTYIELQHIDRDRYKDIAGNVYQKFVIALLREDALEDAATIGLEYREKLNDSELWHESQIYKLLKQECDARDIDDSVLE